jgi:hypothetical protein
MRIFVKAKPNARKCKVEKINDTNFVVSINEPPDKGKANKKLIELLSGYFKVSPFQITILKGAKSRHKLIEIK